MRHFSTATIKEAIERLEKIKGNWLLPAFVFAANDVGSALVDLSEKLGTDTFLDRYFNGRLLGIPPYPNGTNLLRPRFKDVTKWQPSQEFAGDYIIRQPTKLWANLFSSRGYREMRQRGFLAGEKTITALTDAFQPQFELEIPADFRFEDLLVWLFAFQGLPDEVNSWPELMQHLLVSELKLDEFQPQYRGRFKISDPAPPWPELLAERPSNEEFLNELAPRLVAYLANGGGASEHDDDALPPLGEDDSVRSAISAAIQNRDSFTFLLAGPPGTGKTRYARQLATAFTGGDKSRSLFLQFHPALGYDDFMEGFRPAKADSGSGVHYSLEPRLFLKFAQEAAKNLDVAYVLVIDELNRGDVARVFGEALTYLEADYRGQTFTLPFSGEEASLPRNLIIIATANPFDRSVTDLDDALLRRFWVIELEPNGALLQSHLQAEGVEMPVVNRTLRLFNILNEAFPAGFGHTSFLRVRTVEDLNAIWASRVRLALKRTLLHDRKSYDATAAEIEALLGGNEAEGGDEDGAPG